MSSARDVEEDQTFHRTPYDHPELEPEATGYDNVDEFGFASCTEGLGFESSNMIATSCRCDCCCFSERSVEVRRERRLLLSPEKKDFPPPLSSLSVNGRRNFTLEAVRCDGRLEILRVSINRPEILWASRLNGRLRLHLVGSDDDDDEEETGEEEKDEIELIGEEERQNDVGETKADEVEAPEEDREWNIPAVRRCYEREVLYAWSQQQRTRCVTTM